MRLERFCLDRLPKRLIVFRSIDTGQPDSIPDVARSKNADCIADLNSDHEGGDGLPKSRFRGQKEEHKGEDGNGPEPDQVLCLPQPFR